MKQKLTHWADEGNKKFLLKGITEHYFLKFSKQNLNLKPTGVWISVNKSWEKWVNGNWDSWLNGKVCLNVELSKDINLFIIKSKQQFLDKFKELTGEDYPTDFLKTKIELFILFHEKLKEFYDGMWLEEEPFYAHRLDMLNTGFDYFYSWDCESICVWNLDKIKFKESKKKTNKKK